MGFKVTATATTSTNTDRPQVDYAALVFGECFG